MYMCLLRFCMTFPTTRWSGAGNILKAVRRLQLAMHVRCPRCTETEVTMAMQGKSVNSGALQV